MILIVRIGIEHFVELGHLRIECLFGRSIHLADLGQLRFVITDQAFLALCCQPLQTDIKLPDLETALACR